MKTTTSLRSLALACALALSAPLAHAQLTITAANVLPSSQAVLRSGTAGEAIVQGKAVALDAATNKLFLADVSDASDSKVVGIAVNAAALNQPIDYVVSDPQFTIGATIAIGTLYCLGGGGAVNDCSGLYGDSGNYMAFLGLPISTTQLKLSIVRADVLTP